MRIASCGIVQRVFAEAWAVYETVATLPISPSLVGINSISTVRSSPVERCTEIPHQVIAFGRGLGRRVDHARAMRHFVANRRRPRPSGRRCCGPAPRTWPPCRPGSPAERISESPAPASAGLRASVRPVGRCRRWPPPDAMSSLRRPLEAVAGRSGRAVVRSGAIWGTRGGELGADTQPAPTQGPRWGLVPLETRMDWWPSRPATIGCRPRCVGPISIARRSLRRRGGGQVVAKGLARGGSIPPSSPAFGSAGATGRLLQPSPIRSVLGRG